MKKHALILFFLIFCLSKNFGQVKDIGISFNKKGYIQELDLANNYILINYIDKESIYTEKLIVGNTPDIEVDKKKISLKDLKCGMEVLISGEYFETQNLSNATKITVTNQEGVSVSIEKGKLDAITGDYAFIDGNRIKLQSKQKITGIKKSGYSGKSFGAFTELKLGSLVNVEGKYTSSGYLLANEVAVAPEKEKDQVIRTKQSQGDFEEPTRLWSNPNTRTSLLGSPLSDEANILNNEEVQNYIYSITERLTPANLEDKVHFTIIVTDVIGVEAYSLPNGIIFLSKGMLFEIYNEAQLAGILAHEMAHIIYEHGAKRFFENENAVDKTGKHNRIAEHLSDAVKKFKPTFNLKDKNGKQIFSKYMDTKSTDILIKQLPSATALRLLSQHSIEEELQADRVGLSLMFLAGYDPSEAAIIWKNRFNKEAYNEAHPKSKNTGVASNDPLKQDGDLVDLGFDYFNNALIKKVDNINTKALHTHPDHKRRFEEINKLIGIYYSNPEMTKTLKINESEYQNMIKDFRASEEKRIREIENERKKKAQYDKQFKQMLPKIKQKLTAITKPILTYKSYSLKPVVNITELIGKFNCPLADIKQQVTVAQQRFQTINEYLKGNLTEINSNGFDPEDKDRAFAMNYLLAQRANELSIDFATAVAICDYERAKQKNPSIDEFNNLINQILESTEYENLVNTLSTKK